MHTSMHTSIQHALRYSCPCVQSRTPHTLRPRSFSIFFILRPTNRRYLGEEVTIGTNNVRVGVRETNLPQGLLLQVLLLLQWFNPWSLEEVCDCIRKVAKFYSGSRHQNKRSGLSRFSRIEWRELLKFYFSILVPSRPLSPCIAYPTTQHSPLARPPQRPCRNLWREGLTASLCANSAPRAPGVAGKPMSQRVVRGRTQYLSQPGVGVGSGSNYMVEGGCKGDSREISCSCRLEKRLSLQRIHV